VLIEGRAQHRSLRVERKARRHPESHPPLEGGCRAVVRAVSAATGPNIPQPPFLRWPTPGRLWRNPARAAALIVCQPMPGCRWRGKCVGGLPRPPTCPVPRSQ
jgi:hypothetical protein